jgi:hypothetical protein
MVAYHVQIRHASHLASIKAARDRAVKEYIRDHPDVDVKSDPG